MSLFRAPEVFRERGFLWPLDVHRCYYIMHRNILWIQNMVVRNGPHIKRKLKHRTINNVTDTAPNVNGVDFATGNHIEAHNIS